MVKAITQQKIVVIGNGMVGHHFVEQLSQYAKYEITVLSAEVRLAYDRVHLSEYFSGKTADELALTSPENYQALGIHFVLNAKVIRVDKLAQTVTTQQGDVYAYDKLVFATGSFPFIPPIKGNDRQHCLVYRTIDDLEAIHTSAKQGLVGVVIGGGLLGLEAANALKQLGMQTHVVEFSPQLMSIQLDKAGSNLLTDMIEELGVTVHTEKATTEIIDGDERRHRMVFADGSYLETDLILFSAGIRPHDNLARECGLDIGERGGITVNNYCQTSDSKIYAIGECALWNNFIFGLVAPGYAMAKVAAGHIRGLDQQFTGADMSTKLKLMGLDVGSIGDAHGNSQGAQIYTYENQPEQIYKKLVVSENGKNLLGVVLVGDTSDYDTLLQYTLNGLELPSAPESLILPNLYGEKPLLAVDALPVSAVICSCHNVTKGDISAAINSGKITLNDVQSYTKAGTGCGGCAALLKNVFDAELLSCRAEIEHGSCESLAYCGTELSKSAL